MASVAVVGLGRVGLPLALSFADRGLEVIGVERQAAVLEQVAAGHMPFRETGTQELLERVLASGRLERSRAVQDAARADHIVLTLGTPSHVHIEIDMSQIRQAVDDLLPVLHEGHSLILRSTVAPGTTEWVAGYIEQRRGFRVGEDLFVSHVPERIAENHFLEEIATLPCIIGGVGEARGESGRAVRGVRNRDRADRPGPGRAGQDLDQHPAHPVRAAQPADDGAEQYGANVFEVIDLINHDYPRGGIAAPGLTAGACLRKDFTFSEERRARRECC